MESLPPLGCECGIWHNEIIFGIGVSNKTFFCGTVCDTHIDGPPLVFAHRQIKGQKRRDGVQNANQGLDVDRRKVEDESWLSFD